MIKSEKKKKRRAGVDQGQRDGFGGRRGLFSRVERDRFGGQR